MKIESSGFISIDGPLSRNFAIRSLEKGDIVDVKVLSMKGEKSAIVDFKGNKLQLDFSAQPPLSEKYSLELTDVRGGRLQFRLTNLKSSDGSDIFKLLPFQIMNITPPVVREIIARNEKYNLTMYQLMKLVFGIKESGKGGDIIPLLKYLLMKGFSSGDVSAASAFLSGLNEKQSSALGELLSALQDDSEETENDFSGSDDNLFEIIKENDDNKVNLFYIDGDTFHPAEIIYDKSAFFGHIELPSLGEIEFFVYLDDNIDILFSCNDEIVAFLNAGFNNLQNSLRSHYRSVDIRVIPFSKMNSGIGAFVNSLSKGSFDARA